MYYRMTNNHGISYMSSLRRCLDRVLASKPHEILLKDNQTIALNGDDWKASSRVIKSAFSANKNKIAVSTDNGIYFIEGME